MARLSTQDTSFLALETPAVQVHVGLSMTRRVPSGARADFLQRRRAHLAGGTVDTEPCNLRLVEGKRLGRHAPSWKVAGEVDLGYHLRRVALPWPDGEREPGLAVSHLHSLRFFAELLGRLGRTNVPRSAPRIPRGIHESRDLQRARAGATPVFRRRLHFGLVGCPDTLPGVQYLAVQLPVALRALEASLARARDRRGSARVAQVDR